MLNEQMI